MRLAFTLFLILSLFTKVYAGEWHNYDVPLHGFQLNSIISHDNSLFTCGNDGIILKSDDGFETYNRLLVQEKYNNEKFNQMCSFSDIIFTSSEAGNVIYSTDNGMTWNELLIPNKKKIFDMKADDSHLIIACEDATCLIINSSLDIEYSTIPDIDNNDVLAVEIMSSGEFIAGGIGAFLAKSDDLGKTWTITRNVANISDAVTDIHEADGIIYASTSYGWIVYSKNKGNSWLIKNKDQEPKAGLSIAPIYNFRVINGNKFLAFGPFSGQYQSVDGGDTWSLVKVDGYFGFAVNDILTFDNKIFIVGETNYNSSIIQVASDFTSKWGTRIFENNLTYDDSFIESNRLTNEKGFSINNDLYYLSKNKERSYIKGLGNKSDIVIECDSNVAKVFPFENKVFVTYLGGVFRMYDSNFESFEEYNLLDTVSYYNEVSYVAKITHGYMIFMRTYDIESNTDNLEIYAIDDNGNFNKLPDSFRQDAICISPVTSLKDNHVHFSTFKYDKNSKQAYGMFSNYNDNLEFGLIDTNTINPNIFSIKDIYYKTDNTFSYVLKNNEDSTYTIKDYNEDTSQWSVVAEGVSDFKHFTGSLNITHINDTLLIGIIRNGDTDFLFDSNDEGVTWSIDSSFNRLNFTYNPSVNDLFLFRDTVFAFCGRNRIAYKALSPGTSVEEKRWNKTETLYVETFPNPATSQLNVEFDGIIDSIDLYDLQGKMVLNSYEKEIDISDLKQGPYFVKVSSNGKSYFSQFVVAR